MTMKGLMLGIGLSVVVLSGVAWWWLAAPDKGGRESSLPTPDEPVRGLRMEKFSLRDTQRHQTRWEILADIAQVDPRANTTAIEGVNLTLYSVQHGTVQVTARQGLIQNQSRDMRVCGDVRLVVGQEFSLRTECLQWHASEQALDTETAVSVHMGNLQVEGQGFRGWIAEERFEIQHQVLARWSEP
jgi:LPS export ABC transporter protein LptC